MADLSLDDYIQKKRPDQGFSRGVSGSSKFQNLKVAVNRNGQPKPLMGRQLPNPSRTNFNVTGVSKQFDARQKLAQPQVVDARQKLQLKTKFTDARVRIQNKQAEKHAGPPKPVGPPKPLLAHKVVVSPQDARKKITMAKLQAKKLDARQLIKNRKQGAGEPSAKSSHPTQLVTGPGRGAVKVSPGVTAAGGSLLRTIKSDTQMATDTQRVAFGTAGKVTRSVGGPFSKTIVNPVVKTTTVTRRPNNNIVLAPSSAPPQPASHNNPQTMRRMPVIHIQNDSYQPPPAVRDPPASAPAVSRAPRQQPAPYQHQEPMHYQPQQQQQALYQPAPQSQHPHHHHHHQQQQQPPPQQQPVVYQQQPQIVYQESPLAPQQPYYSSDPQPVPVATHYRDPQPPGHRAHMDMYDTRRAEVAMATHPYQAPEPDLGGRVAVVRSKAPAVAAAVAAPRPVAGSVQSRLSDPVLPTDDMISPLQGYKVLITNLHPIVSQADILELFGAVGALKKVRLLKDGVAEVIFVHKEEALAAVSKYNLRELDGQPMNVKMASVTTAAAPPKPAADTSQPLRSQRVQQPGGQKVDSDNVDLGLLHRALFKTPKEDGPARPVTFTVKI